MKLHRHAAIALLLLAVTAAYANHFGNGFHFDDFHTVVDNPAIRSLHNVPSFFTDASTFSVLPANRTYRPLVSSTLALDYALGHGYKPFWFHLGTFLLFLLQVWLLFALYRLLLNKIRESPTNHWLALLGAGWFGLHPAMAETVNYVIQRGDLYCTIGCVAALWLYARFPKLRRFGLYLLPFVLAMLSKPPAAVFPVLLLLYVYFFEAAPSSRRWRTSLATAVPALLVTLALLALQSAMTPKSFLPSIIPAWDYRLTQPYVWLRYFGELFLPLHLNVDTDLTPFHTFGWRALAGLAFLVALAATIWLAARRRQLYPVAYGLLWFVLTQLPTSLYPLSEVENDHRMFFSFPGLILAVLAAGAVLLRRVTTEQQRMRLQPAMVAVGLLALGGYAYGTYVRNIVWHTEGSLWLDDVHKSPHNGRGLMIYGLDQMSKGNYPVALDYFERALQYTPNYPTLEINLGVVNGAMALDEKSPQKAAERTAEAQRHFLRAIELAPEDDTTHAYYGRWLSETGHYPAAIQQLHTAIQLNPSRLFQREQLITAYEDEGDLDLSRQAAQQALAVAPGDAIVQQTLMHPPAQNAAFWINLSLAQYRQGEFQRSIDTARRALALDPHSPEAYNNIGAGEAGLLQWDAAIHDEREALRLRPGFQIAQNNLNLYMRQQKRVGVAQTTPAPAITKTEAGLLNESLALNRAGKYEESIAAARGALQLDPKSAIAWNNIAAANEALHRWDIAIDAAQRALAIDPDLQLAKNNLAWSRAQKSAP